MLAQVVLGTSGPAAMTSILAMSATCLPFACPRPSRAASGYWAVSPPSTITAEPVVKRESSQDRNSAARATSSGSA